MKMPVQMQDIPSSVFDGPQSGIVLINCLSLSLVDPTLWLQLHCKRDNVMDIFAMIAWSDDLLPAHWTLGDAFAGLGTLIFASY